MINLRFLPHHRIKKTQNDQKNIFVEKGKFIEKLFSVIKQVSVNEKQSY